MTYISAQAYSPKTRILLFSLISIMILASITLLMPYGWMVALCMTLTVLIVRPLAAQQRSSVQVRPHTEPTLGEWDHAMPRMQRRVLLQDGREREGLLVPNVQEQEWRLMLTHDGYVLVDQHDQVRYTLS